MPDSVVWMPFHSLNGANPGHLVWDDFLPMYTLLDMFQLLPENPYQEDHQQASSMTWFPMRYVLETNEKNPRGLWASCDVRAQKTEECNHLKHELRQIRVYQKPSSETEAQSAETRQDNQQHSPHHTFAATSTTTTTMHHHHPNECLGPSQIRSRCYGLVA